MTTVDHRPAVTDQAVHTFHTAARAHIDRTGDRSSGGATRAGLAAVLAEREQPRPAGPIVAGLYVTVDADDADTLRSAGWRYIGSGGWPTAYVLERAEQSTPDGAR